jgi:hypothetical protein
MSFNRLNYDTCEYKQTLAQSIGPGHYQVNTPPIDCNSCYPYPPSIRLQSSGASVNKDINAIDIDSEMLNITRPASKCPSKKYMPICPGSKCNTGEPCGQGVSDVCNNKGEMAPTNFTKGTTSFPDCEILPQEETRTSNPPCNLRGTGWNRWEWLCLNPQDKIEMPFDWNISNRIITKDNHRPCIPNPIDPVRVLPLGGTIPCEKTKGVCGTPTNPTSVQWRNLSEIKKY